jgi:hypothetical protein
VLRETEARIHIKDLSESKKFLQNWYEEYKAIGQVQYHHGKEDQFAKYNYCNTANKLAKAIDRSIQHKMVMQELFLKGN